MTNVKKDKKTLSTWDDDVDYEKVKQLNPKEKHKLFPNEFDPSGKPYGDF